MQLYERLRYLEPSAEFRTTWQYQNLMYMTAGYLAGQLTASTWESQVRARIFEPLGMRRSNFSVHESQLTDDFAYPYASYGNDVRQIDFRNVDAIGPAGSINSSVVDMIRFVRFLLDKGEYDGEQLLSESNATQMQTPQVDIPRAVRYEELGVTGYGMGLFVTTYRGHLLLHHGGDIDGFSALLSFMPQDSVGVIVLTNLSGTPAPTIVTRGVYDRILGLVPLDWTRRVRERQAQEKRTAAGNEKHPQRVEGTSISHELAGYAGTYEHPAYGTIRVSLNGDGLRATFNGVTSPLEHFHYDIFELPEDPMVYFSGRLVVFYDDKRGVIDRLLVALEPEVEDIVFTRVAEKMNGGLD
jgi:CubicO group peptidase (beta-lactamase class C family)